MRRGSTSSPPPSWRQGAGAAPVPPVPSASRAARASTGAGTSPDQSIKRACVRLHAHCRTRARGRHARTRARAHAPSEAPSARASSTNCTPARAGGRRAWRPPSRSMMQGIEPVHFLEGVRGRLPKKQKGFWGLGGFPRSANVHMHSASVMRSGGGLRRTLACFATLLILQSAAAFGASGTCARRSLCAPCSRGAGRRAAPRPPDEEAQRHADLRGTRPAGPPPAPFPYSSGQVVPSSRRAACRLPSAMARRGADAPRARLA